MHQHSARRPRRRTDARATYVVGLGLNAGLLVLINVVPGWEAVPFLTPGAEPAIALLNLALIGELVAQSMSMVDERLRLRALASYAISLLCMAAVAQLWVAFPFDFGSAQEAWAGATRMVLVGLFGWAVLSACRAAVRVVRGRRAPRLSASHA